MSTGKGGGGRQEWTLVQVYRRSNTGIEGVELLGNGPKEVRWYLAQVPRQNGFWGSAQDIMKGNIQAHGQVFKSQVIVRTRVSPADLEGLMVFTCQ